MVIDTNAIYTAIEEMENSLASIRQQSIKIRELLIIKEVLSTEDAIGARTALVKIIKPLYLHYRGLLSNVPAFAIEIAQELDIISEILLTIDTNLQFNIKLNDALSSKSTPATKPPVIKMDLHTSSATYELLDRVASSEYSMGYNTIYIEQPVRSYPYLDLNILLGAVLKQKEIETDARKNAVYRTLAMPMSDYITMQQEVADGLTASPVEYLASQVASNATHDRTLWAGGITPQDISAKDQEEYVSIFHEFPAILKARDLGFNILPSDSTSRMYITKRDAANLPELNDLRNFGFAMKIATSQILGSPCIMIVGAAHAAGIYKYLQHILPEVTPICIYPYHESISPSDPMLLHLNKGHSKFELPEKYLPVKVDRANLNASVQQVLEVLGNGTLPSSTVTSSIAMREHRGYAMAKNTSPIKISATARVDMEFEGGGLSSHREICYSSYISSHSITNSAVYPPNLAFIMGHVVAGIKEVCEFAGALPTSGRVVVSVAIGELQQSVGFNATPAFKALARSRVSRPLSLPSITHQPLHCHPVRSQVYPYSLTASSSGSDLLGEVPVYSQGRRIRTNRPRSRRIYSWESLSAEEQEIILQGSTTSAASRPKPV